ncbi:MAG: bifunctional nuclease family protein [Phycisphaerae bacterium]|jgi:bifunctional DNase/RNase
MDVPMELARIVINTAGGQQKIYLRERGGKGRVFQIGIGLTEALAIDRRLKGVPFHRPLTHELLANTIQALGGTLEKIVINDLRYDVEDGWGTFIATLYIRQGGQMITVDSRPSDAIALGAALGTPIYAAEKVLQDAAEGPGEPKDRIEMLRRRMDLLANIIQQLSTKLNDEKFLAATAPETLQEHRQQLAMMKHEYEAIDRLLREVL